MFRTFVERKVRRQILHTSLLISTAAFIAIVLLWYVDALAVLIHPLRMFIDNIHGGITNLAMLLTGGSVESFTLSPEGNYTITFRDGIDAVFLPAGYLGSALLGALMFYLINRLPHLVRGLSLITGVFTVAYLLLFIRPNETGDIISIAICAGLGLFLIALGLKGKGDPDRLRSRRTVVQVVMNIVALMTALHIILDLQYVLRTPARDGDIIINPVAAFASEVLSGASVQVIALIWSAVAFVLLGVAFHFSIIRPLRQIPKNDDIV